MNVDRTEAAAARPVTFWLTVWCALPTAGGWGPPPDWLSSCIADEQASRLQTPGSLERQHHVQSHWYGYDWGLFPFSLRCISDRKSSSRGRRCWIHIFCGFLFVALQHGLYRRRTGRTISKHCIVGLLITARGRMAGDAWSYCVCSETPTLFSSRKK